MNSLYGRFGMAEIMPRHVIVSSEIFKEMMYNSKLEIHDFIELDNDLILVTFIIIDDSSKELNIGFNNDDPNINVAIASAITALARVEMAEYLGDSNLNIWATDTDSLITDSKLPTSDELGDLKLEAEYDEACFIAPKVYGAKLKNGESFTKVKGYKNSLPYDKLKTLLPRNSKLELKQDKWIKNYNKGNIKINHTVYSLKATDNKRMLVIKNNKFVDTKPYIIDYNKNISKKNTIDSNPNVE